MKTNRQSFSGTRPIFTGSPAIVPGGFNLDKDNQSFTVGQSIPAGTLAIYDEATRLVKILKTAKVKAIQADDAKIVTLETDENYEPLFVVGEKVLKTITGAYADAPSIAAISNTDAGYVITLSAAIAGLAVGDILVQVVSKNVVSTPVIAGVKSVDGVDAAKIEIAEPVDIAADDYIMAYPLAAGALYANAVKVVSYNKITGAMVLESNVDVAVAGAQIVKVYEGAAGAAVTTKTTGNAALIGNPNSLVLSERYVDQYEVGIDVTHDTMQYAVFERRILPIPADLKENGALKANPHIKLSQSY
ncbi:MAG: hypothetical protein AB2L20_11920 [Mangrovibacterium sp.]